MPQADPQPPRVPIFDGHNDALTDLLRPPGRGPRDLLERGSWGHLDLPRAREGGLAGGLFAVFVPRDPATPPPDPEIIFNETGYEVPLPPPLELGYAQRETLAGMARLYRLEARSGGQVRVCRTAAEIQASLDAGVLAAVLHLEGADAIDPDLNALEVFVQAGLRSLGPVWSRPNAFGHGVPFAHPRGPDTGPGLTPAGFELVRACNRLRVLVDLSHLNERGFWDVAETSNAPLVATHSNAHALCPATRNLTND
ncbi:MAG TPA: membrane dipeptidase, partial [Deinococcales bacterium]|nr:membrane dipeptidase [Deinococcales bacterium]